MSRLNKIVRGGVLGMVEIEWLDDARRNGLINEIGMNEQNEYLDTLYQLSEAEIYSQTVNLRAAEVYQGICKDVHK